MSNTTTYANQCNSFSPSSIVEMLSGYGCKKMWLYRTTNTQGETLLVLLDEENGILTAVINPVRFLKGRLRSIWVVLTKRHGIWIFYSHQVIR